MASMERRQLSTSRRSASITRHLAPPLLSSFSILWPASASRSMMTGMPPSWPQARAIAAPIPLAPPVTTITLFSSCNSIPGPLPVAVCGVHSEDLFLVGHRQVPDIAGDQFHYLPVTGCQQTHRPIGTKNYAVHTKDLKHQVEVGCEVPDSPLLPVCFRHQ